MVSGMVAQNLIEVSSAQGPGLLPILGVRQFNR